MITRTSAEQCACPETLSVNSQTAWGIRQAVNFLPATFRDWSNTDRHLRTILTNAARHRRYENRPVTNACLLVFLKLFLSSPYLFIFRLSVRGLMPLCRAAAAILPWHRARTASQ